MTRHYPIAIPESGSSRTIGVVRADSREDARQRALRVWPWAARMLGVIDGCRPDLTGGCGGAHCNGTLVRIPWQEGHPEMLPES